MAKNKNFITPIGAFSFNHLHLDIYPLGIVQKEARRGVYFLMATLEKAVLDYLILKTDDRFFKSPEDLPVFFEQDLRADWADLTTAMDANVLQSWLPHYARRKRIKWFIQLIIKGKK